MRRFVLFGSALALVLFAIASLLSVAAAQQTSAQTPSRDLEGRLDQALRQIQSLNTQVTSQASRIANLERSVGALQDQLRTPTGSRWKTAEGWAELRTGMSRADVEYILGPPRRVDSVIDKQTLTYGTATNIVGTVIVVDDRVSEVNAPGFKIMLPEPGK